MQMNEQASTQRADVATVRNTLATAGSDTSITQICSAYETLDAETTGTRADLGMKAAHIFPWRLCCGGKRRGLSRERELKNGRQTEEISVLKGSPCVLEEAQNM